MWTHIASFVLRQRVPLLLGLLAVTVFFAMCIPNLRLQYTFGGLLPENDSTALDYEHFIEHFGAEGNVVLIGTGKEVLNDPSKLQAWYELTESIQSLPTVADTIDDGVDNPVPLPMIDSVFSITHAYTLSKDTAERRFVVRPIVRPGRMETGGAVDQAFTDSLRNSVLSLPFYEGFLYTKDADATLLMVFLDPALFNSERRGTVVEDITRLADQWSLKHDQPLYMSGLPFIRTQMTNKVKGEIGYFIGAALLVTALLLFLFFRNPTVMGVSLIVVTTGVIWSLGTMVIFDFPITLLMSLIPPLMIVIGVPNCIYLVNKYHAEFKRHGNKMMSLQRMIVKVGNATLLTNFTTALGFATFIFTHSSLLRTFGIVASINILAVFVISIIVIPALMLWLPAPRPKHTRHLDRRWMFIWVNHLVRIVQFHRPKVYLGALAVLTFSILGLLRMETTGNIVDDLPDSDRVITDLKWMEERFHGAMPFEVLVDTKKPGKATSSAMLNRIEKLQQLLAEYPQFSRSLSAGDAMKFAMQAFYNGDPDRYRLPNRRERSFIGPYLRGTEEAASGSDEAAGISSNFMDSTNAVTRISTQMADIGTLEMRDLMNELRPRIDSIFPAEEYRMTLTGTSVVFLEGTSYMVKNLGISIALAICVIAGMMALLFRSSRMVLIALIPNLFPLLFTAGIMGWAGIPIKPSTILVFSIAFGISVDDTIHFLAKYRQELNLKSWNIGQAVVLALKETGVSMMYTSIVLFFGFLMFALSEFDGTRSLGLLVSITLSVAMFTNLLLLPSLLLAFEKVLTTQSFREPFFSLLDEEEDIEVEELAVRQGLAPGKGDELHEDLVRKRSLRGEEQPPT
jgi:predicted RND superfamily exporter protein